MRFYGDSDRMQWRNTADDRVMCRYGLVCECRWRGVRSVCIEADIKGPSTRHQTTLLAVDFSDGRGATVKVVVLRS